MFVNACEIATQFTRPVIVSTRCVDGRVVTTLAAFVILNDQGWMATAAHVLDPVNKHRADMVAVASYLSEKQSIMTAEKDMNRLRSKVKRLDSKTPGDLAQNVSVWWASDTATAAEIYAYGDEIDIAVCRLDNFDPSTVGAFPTFKKPAELKSGSSLVKIGFPFHEIRSTWDDSAQAFRIAPEAFPVPLFPIDGIVTRFAEGPMSPDGLPVKLVETSSPGLLGQSGGPTLDTAGVVWAIQSRTLHHPLGFKAKTANRDVERQFLNVGIGVHCETLQAIFDRHGITVDWTG
jgi:hypothetical protein